MNGLMKAFRLLSLALALRTMDKERRLREVELTIQELGKP